MPSSFLGLNTAYSGLCYFQAANNTTAHNVSNASTEGYTRQRVIAKATNAIRVHQSYGMMGTGVSLSSIEQIRNLYYDNKYRLNSSKLSTYSTESDYQLQIEGYLDEIISESGYTEMMSQINSAIEDLTINPAGDTERTQYKNSLSTFTTLINEVSNNLQQSQRDANDEISLTVDRINSIARQLYKLGQEITMLETDGTVANDLRDQRNLLLDELAGLVNMEAVERPVTYGVGDKRKESPATTLEVRINGELLVDSVGYRQLTVIPRVDKVNQNDIDGLYDVHWDDNSGGELFNLNSLTMDGKLKGLYEIRDGNNCENLQGEITDVTASTVTVSLAEPIPLQELNINEEGAITLNTAGYYYEGWNAEYETNAKGETVITSITFENIRYRVTEDDARHDETLTVGTLASKDLTTIDPPILGRNAMQGRSVDAKGVPYYMAQLNEFVRTISKYMNDLHTSGADKNGDPGIDLFSATDLKGDDYVLTGSVGETGTLTSGDSSYWKITSLNWAVNTQIMRDNDKVVVSFKEDIEQNNVDAHPILDDILYGFSDAAMFRQGTPFQFMNSISSSIAVDAMKSAMFVDNLDRVVQSIDNQRLSESSVDTNEEAANLVIFQNGYNLNSKVLSVLNEMLDKLINETGF